MPFETIHHTPGHRERVPFQTTPQNRSYRVALVYKNFKAMGTGHIGLGVTALNTMKYLRAKGIYAEVRGVTAIKGLIQKMDEAAKHPADMYPVTHIVISAPWLPAADLQDIAILNPQITFASVCHSNMPFLAADPNAFKLVRQYMDVERSTANFHLAGNSERLTGSFGNIYAVPCWTIPNLYMLDGLAIPTRPLFNGDTLRIGCFGAMRILKNILSAGSAALEIASQMRVDLEFWISTGRNEGAQGTYQSLKEMYDGVKFATIKEQCWQEWSPFRSTIRHMHLLLQPSFTESFNNVTADGIAEGVPSAVSRAITWVPDNWKADGDDSSDIAAVGRRLLSDPGAPAAGLNALTAYNNTAFALWVKFLTDTSPHM